MFRPAALFAALALSLTVSTARAQGGLLSLLGQRADTPAPEASPAPAANGGSSSGSTGGGWRIPSMNDIRNALGVPKVPISPEENAALERLKRILWKLAGPNERFCYGDLDDIVAQLHGELDQRVRQEIGRRAAQETERGVFPRIRGRLVQRNISRNWGEYYGGGMQQAGGMVRTGLSQFLRETDCTVNVPDRSSDSRQLTLADLEQLKTDGPVLRTISDRAAALGLPGFKFPNGMGWRDIEAIRTSSIPPNGVMQPRARPAERAPGAGSPGSASLPQGAGGTGAAEGGTE